MAALRDTTRRTTSSESRLPGSVTFCIAIAHHSGTGTSVTNCNLHLLAFVTGAFGTNMSGLSYPLTLVWICFVTLIVVAAMFRGYELTHMLRTEGG